MDGRAPLRNVKTFRKNALVPVPERRDSPTNEELEQQGWLVPHLCPPDPNEDKQYMKRVRKRRKRGQYTSPEPEAPYKHQAVQVSIGSDVQGQRKSEKAVDDLLKSCVNLYAALFSLRQREQRLNEKIDSLCAPCREKCRAERRQGGGSSDSSSAEGRENGLSGVSAEGRENGLPGVSAEGRENGLPGVSAEGRENGLSAMMRAAQAHLEAKNIRLPSETPSFPIGNNNNGGSVNPLFPLRKNNDAALEAPLFPLNDNNNGGAENLLFPLSENNNTDSEAPLFTLNNSPTTEALSFRIARAYSLSNENFVSAEGPSSDKHEDLEAEDACNKAMDAIQPVASCSAAGVSTDMEISSPSDKGEALDAQNTRSKALDIGTPVVDKATSPTHKEKTPEDRSSINRAPEDIQHSADCNVDSLMLVKPAPGNKGKTLDARNTRTKDTKEPVTTVSADKHVSPPKIQEKNTEDRNNASRASEDIQPSIDCNMDSPLLEKHDSSPGHKGKTLEARTTRTKDTKEPVAAVSPEKHVSSQEIQEKATEDRNNASTASGDIQPSIDCNIDGPMLEKHPPSPGNKGKTLEVRTTRTKGLDTKEPVATVSAEKHDQSPKIQKKATEDRNNVNRAPEDVQPSIDCNIDSPILEKQALLPGTKEKALEGRNIRSKELHIIKPAALPAEIDISSPKSNENSTEAEGTRKKASNKNQLFEKHDLTPDHDEVHLNTRSTRSKASDTSKPIAGALVEKSVSSPKKKEVRITRSEASATTKPDAGALVEKSVSSPKKKEARITRNEAPETAQPFGGVPVEKSVLSPKNKEGRITRSEASNTTKPLSDPLVEKRVSSPRKNDARITRSKASDTTQPLGGVLLEKRVSSPKNKESQNIRSEATDTIQPVATALFERSVLLSPKKEAETTSIEVSDTSEPLISVLVEKSVLLSPKKEAETTSIEVSDPSQPLAGVLVEKSDSAQKNKEARNTRREASDVLVEHLASSPENTRKAVGTHNTRSKALDHPLADISMEGPVPSPKNREKAPEDRSVEVISSNTRKRPASCSADLSNEKQASLPKKKKVEVEARHTRGRPLDPIQPDVSSNPSVLSGKKHALSPKIKENPTGSHNVGIEGSNSNQPSTSCETTGHLQASSPEKEQVVEVRNTRRRMFTLRKKPTNTSLVRPIEVAAPNKDEHSKSTSATVLSLENRPTVDQQSCKSPVELSSRQDTAGNIENSATAASRKRKLEDEETTVEEVESRRSPRKTAPKSPVESPVWKTASKSAVESPNRKTAPKSPVESPVRKIAVESPVRKTASKSPVESPVRKTAVESPVRKIAPKSPVESPDRKTAPKSPDRKTASKSPVESPVRKTASKSAFESPDRKTAPKSPVESPVRKAMISPGKSPKAARVESGNSNDSTSAGDRSNAVKTRAPSKLLTNMLQMMSIPEKRRLLHKGNRLWKDRDSS